MEVFVPVKDIWNGFILIVFFILVDVPWNMLPFLNRVIRFQKHTLYELLPEYRDPEESYADKLLDIVP